MAWQLAPRRYCKLNSSDPFFFWTVFALTTVSVQNATKAFGTTLQHANLSSFSLLVARPPKTPRVVTRLIVDSRADLKSVGTGDNTRHTTAYTPRYLELFHSLARLLLHRYFHDTEQEAQQRQRANHFRPQSENCKRMLTQKIFRIDMPFSETGGTT